jgi:hypothetical protein
VRHAILALVLASNACSTCREDRHANAVDSSMVEASTTPAATAPPSASSATSEGDASPPSPAPWELVAKRKSTDHPLFIAEVGTRVVVGDASPIAWADGAGPLVAAPKIATDYTSAVAGTYPSAVFVATEKRVHQLAGDGWRDLGPIPPHFRTMVTWGDRGAVIVSSFIELNSMPTIGPDERPATTLKALVADGEPPPASFDLDPAFGTFAASGTRDGHLWLLGFRAGKPGMWLAHLKLGQKTGYQLYPNSEKCDDAGFGIYVYRSTVVATSGDHAFLFVVNDAAECMSPIGAYLYERSDKGFGGIPLPKNADESMGTHVIGRAHDGTLYFAMLDETAWRRTRNGKTTRLAVPKGCVATQVVVKDDGDTWMTARCEGHDGVYRRGRPQTPLAL